MQTFFPPPIVLIEEEKWLLAVTSFEAMNFVFNVTDENNSFSIIISSHWNSKSAGNTIKELNKLLEFKSQYHIELHLQEVRKRGNQIKNKNREYKLSDFDTLKNEILEELRNVKYNDLEDMVCRMQLTYEEVVDVLDLNYIPTKRTGFSLNQGVYEVSNINIFYIFYPIM